MNAAWGIPLLLVAPLSARPDGQPVVTAVLKSYAGDTGRDRVCVVPKLGPPLETTLRQFGKSAQRAWGDWQDARDQPITRAARYRLAKSLRAALKTHSKGADAWIAEVPRPLILSNAAPYDRGRCNLANGDVWWLGLSRPVLVSNVAFVEAFTLVHGTNPPLELIALQRQRRCWRIVAERFLASG